MSTSPPTLRERVAAAIIEAAAGVLARQGELASMADVAAAAGLARATVYRYFPNRQMLLDELAERALRDAGNRLKAARLDEVPVDEAVARAVRALVGVGDYLIVLARERVRPEPERFEEAIAAPLRRLFERGQSGKEIRGDVPPESLTESLVGLVVSVLVSAPSLGVEDSTAAIAGLFLDGARNREVAAG
jgi:TetR/AcrR family transcriptional regulator, mexCD-oprJ operon repressor